MFTDDKNPLHLASSKGLGLLEGNVSPRMCSSSFSVLPFLPSYLSCRIRIYTMWKLDASELIKLSSVRCFGRQGLCSSGWP